MQNDEITLASRGGIVLTSEITLATDLAPENQPRTIITPEITLAENKSEKFSKEISEIFKSPEFAYAVLATMYANTCHNDQNKFQNDEALKILEKFAEQSPDQDLSENILKLSKFAKDNKKLDRNFSLGADTIRIVAGAIALSASIYESSTKTDDSETRKLNSASEIFQIISFATQIIASPITTNNGYKASFTGHFTDEMADAFNRVSTLLRNKIDGQSIDQSAHICSNPEHNHPVSKAVHGNDCEHGHVHIFHAGSMERHFGSFLNVSSMAMSASRFLSELKHLTESNPAFINSLNSSILALTAPVLSIIGKFSSLRAAEIREKEVLQKISTAKENMIKDFTKIFEKASKAGDSFTSLITIEDATKSLKSELVAIGKKMEGEAEKKRSESGIKMSAKIFLNYIKDSVYGLSYETMKTFYAYVPSLWIADSSVITQSQDLESQDLESQNKGTRNLRDLEELKKEIGADINLLSEGGDPLKNFLLQIEGESQKQHRKLKLPSLRRTFSKRLIEALEPETSLATPLGGRVASNVFVRQ
jgi:hypothetical protein